MTYKRHPTLLLLRLWPFLGLALASSCAAPSTSLHGDWLMTASSSNLGEFRTFVKFSGTDASLRGRSRRRSLSRFVHLPFIGLFEWFVPAVHGGSLFYISKGHIADEHLALTGEIPIGQFHFVGKRDGEKLYGTFRFAGVEGSWTAHRWGDKPPALPTDYAAIFSEVLLTIEQRFYQPLENNRDWQRAVAWAQRRVEWVRDDLEFYVLVSDTFRHAGSSHLTLYREPPGQQSMGIGDTTATNRTVTWKILTPQQTGSSRHIGFVRIGSFIKTAKEIEKAMDAVAHTSGLIIDLRGNGGGDMSAAVVARRLLDRPLTAGYFVSSIARQTPLPLSAQQLAKLPPISMDVVAPETFAKNIEDLGGAAAVRFDGDIDKHYPGPCVVLINGGTGSASEVLLAALKDSESVTLVGRNTAGAVLAGVRVPVGDDWMLQLPILDYFTSNGARLEGRGVSPDIYVDWPSGVARTYDQFDPDVVVALRLLDAEVH